MIAANELRVYNWVLAGKMVEPIQVFTINYECRDGYLINKSIPVADLHPVNLTPEILIKCGFEKDILLLGERGTCSLGWHFISNTYKKETTVNLGYDYDDCAYASHNSEHETEIKHLHQLQNLYFDLTKTELEIKSLIK